MSGNAVDKEKLLRETEAMLRAVLISSPRGVHFEKLQRDYKELTFKRIPYTELGFPRLEPFLQSIPTVARVERGPDGEWVVKGVASDADKHVAKLISKQKKPSLRKSAKSMMAKWKVTPLPARINTPVRKPAPRPQASKSQSKYHLPPRMQRLQEVQNRNKSSFPGQGNVKPGKGKENTVARYGISVGRGEAFKRATDGLKTSAKNETQRKLNSASKESPKLSVSISRSNTERSVTAVTLPTASGILADAASVKFIKFEISKAQSGLWASRLEHLYKEKFKKVLPESFMQELKFRPDITRVDEPISGRFLLYAPKKQQPPPSDANQRDQTRVKVTTDFVLPCYLPDVGTSIIVYISHTENPGCFYVSREDAISEMLSEEIQKHYKSTTHSSASIPSILPGQIFCAKFTEDANFYRACVLEVIDSNQIKVLYVDFGNKEVIHVERLRVLISDFQTQPIQAYECCLDGIQPANQASEWSEAAIDKFDELTSEKALRMTVHEVDGKILTVSLVDVSSQLDVAEELKKAGLAISSKNLESTPSSSSSSLSSSSGVTTERSLPTPESVTRRSRRLKSKSPGIVELPDEQFIDVFVCNITGTYNVLLRLIGEEYSTKFEAIQESMTSYYSDSKDEVTTEPEVGDLFALISDEVWCRVKVIAVNGGKVQVFFVDHGDEIETTKTELRPLADQFRKLPFQVIRCALNGLPNTKNSDVVDKLRKLIMCEDAVAEVIKRTSDLAFIELLDTRTDVGMSVNNVIRKLVIPDEELKPELPDVGKTTDVEIVYISPTGSVFLHVSQAGRNRLEELNKDLTNHYMSKRSKANEFIPKPQAGKVCCAKSYDGNWYRAKILSSTNKDGIEVLYVDYGNTEVVPGTSLREPTQANAHVLSLPFQALECQLYDVPKDGWNDDMVDKIFEIVEQGSLSAEVMASGDTPSVSLLITMETEGEKVTHRLASYLGYSDYEDEDYPVVSENNPENVDGEAGEELVNGGRTVTIMETESAKKTNTETKSVKEANVETNDANQSTKSEEKPVATAEKNVAKVEDEAPVNVEMKDVNEVPVNEVKATSSEAENEALNNEIAANHSQWKALPLETDWFDVYITDVKDPENFTFQLLHNDSEIAKLTDELNNHYQDQVVESEVTLVEGNVYAVLREEDDCWYRGVVESNIHGEKGHVRFLDYGGYATVDKDDIRVLHEKFLELPFQGVPAKLAGVKSKKNKWSRESIKNFKYLTNDRYLVAKVTSGHTECNCDLSSAVTVQLCDTEDPARDVFIAEKLIEDSSDVVPA